MKKHFIELPVHEDMKGTRICPFCEGMMVPCIESIAISLRNTVVTVAGIKGYKCTSCGEVVYNSSEAKLIEEAVRRYIQSEES